MAKRINTSRAQQYRAILAEKDIRLEDCKVLAFAFEQGKPSAFHFRLMFAQHRLRYYLFDSGERTAYVVCSKDENVLQEVRDIAAVLGGKEIQPDLS